MFYCRCQFVPHECNMVAGSCNSVACCNRDCLCQLFSLSLSVSLSLSLRGFSLSELTLCPVSLLLPHSFRVQTQLHRLPWRKRRVLWSHELGLRRGGVVCGENRRNTWGKDTPSHLGKHEWTFSLPLITVSALVFCFHFTNVHTAAQKLW